MAKSKKFCIATEGATTDGRVIERKWLEEMAANYDPKTYGARINLEHIKGITPDSPFKSYGDVLQLSTEEGSDGKLRLYAVIDPTDDLVALSKARQKVYTSMEINPDFADTGKCYLVGLAITDNPASLGTEMLQFNATAKTLDVRKTNPANLFSEAVEFKLELADDASAGLFHNFTEKIKGLLGKQNQATTEGFTQLHGAVTVIAESQGEVLQKFAAIEGTPAKVAELQADLDKLQTEFSALVGKLDSDEPAGQFRTRTPGGTGEEALTDC